MPDPKRGQGRTAASSASSPTTKTYNSIAQVRRAFYPNADRAKAKDAPRPTNPNKLSEPELARW